MKRKIQINNIFGKVLFEYECENNTIAKTLEQAAVSLVDLSYADLSYADLHSIDLTYVNLRYANLSYTNLSCARLRFANLYSADLGFANLHSTDLTYANLSSSNLRYVNLSSANLSSVNLSYAQTDKRYIQIGCIGSPKQMMTYCFEDDFVMCGGFTGTLKEFEERVRETHKDNPQYLKEYTGAIKYINSLK